MNFFTSKRERRLWVWALAILVPIYSTLGVTGAVTGFLRQRNLLEVSFVLGLLLAVGATIVQWVKRSPGRGEIWVALGVAAAYFMVWVRIETPEERTHLFEYGLVAIFIYRALIERRRNGRRIPRPAVLAVVVSALLGWLDEGIQAILPNRVYDIRDVGFNALTGVMAVVASVALDGVRQRGKKSQPPNETP